MTGAPGTQSEVPASDSDLADLDPPADASSTPTMAPESDALTDADPPADASNTPTMAPASGSDAAADPPADASDNDRDQSGWVSSPAMARQRWLPQDDDDD